MTHDAFTTINNLRCTKSVCSLFTEDTVYSVNPYYSDFGNYMVMSDYGDTICISPSTLRPVGLSGYCFEVAEDYISTPEEDEEWQRLEQKQSQEPVDCSISVAHHIHELQKWLKHIGCDSEAEFRISSEYVWASPDEFVIYEAKEGGVGTLIEYMRHIGGANKCLEKMEEL